MPLTVKNFKINSSAGARSVLRLKAHYAGQDFAPPKTEKQKTALKVYKKDRNESLSLKIASRKV